MAGSRSDGCRQLLAIVPYLHEFLDPGRGTKKMSEEIKPGVLVRLKTGGPTMTVDSQIAVAAGVPSDRWKCIWYDVRKHKMETVTVSGAVLEVVPDD